MMKTCLLCNSPVKWLKFKCRGGYVCKLCYEKVSMNFSRTISDKTKNDLLEIAEGEKLSQEEREFTISRKINQLILFDDVQQQICLPNHPKYCKEKLMPEVFPYTAVSNCQIAAGKKTIIVNKKKQSVGTLCVIVMLKEPDNASREIWLLPKAIKTDSTVYRTMEKLAQKIVVEVEKITGTLERILS